MSGRGATSLRRHAAGLLVAPLAVPLLLGAWDAVHVVGLDAPPAKLHAMMRETVRFAATTIAPLGWATALAVGLPILLGLGAVRRLTVPWVVGTSTGAAAVVSAAALAAIPACVGEEDCLSPWLVGAGLGGALGLAVSAVHCAVAGVRWRAGRPASP